jgi:hypothetical protein
MKLVIRKRPLNFPSPIGNEEGRGAPGNCQKGDFAAILATDASIRLVIDLLTKIERKEVRRPLILCPPG